MLLMGNNIYDNTAAPIVEGVMEGFNGTIFAYGQTGAGKTFTMEGVTDPPHLQGIMPNAFRHIFQTIAMTNTEEESDSIMTRFMVRASYLELYNEEVRDLLGKDSKQRLELHESPNKGVYVKGLTAIVVNSVAEMETILARGRKNRSVGQTKMNAESSRSHSLFTVTVERGDTHLEADAEEKFRVGKLNLVDLAGSERQSKTGATGQRLEEAKAINMSLHALGNVIAALVERKPFVPYRGSKLTRLLQDSLGGNTKTLMCANCSPADFNFDETLSTLRFANRAKNIRNKPRINEDPKDAMLREYQQELEDLRKQLAAIENGEEIGMLGSENTSQHPRPVVEVKTVVDERVQEKVVIQEVGLSPEQVAAFEAKAAVEKHRLEQEQKKATSKAMVEKAQEEENVKRLQQQLKSKSGIIKQTNTSKLKERLLKMENRLLIGGKMLDEAKKQEYELRKKKMQMEEERRVEAERAHELQEREEQNLQLEEEYASLQEEVENKAHKLQQLYLTYKRLKAEITDLRNEEQSEREELMASIRTLDRQYRIKNQVMQHFIPPDRMKLIESRMEFDTEQQIWMVRGLEFAGNIVSSQVADSGAETVTSANLMSSDDMFLIYPKKKRRNGGKSGR
eukprot:TRINITY_DN7387_c0_g2_i3.p1 TRINITY_DN7387_c0_g2~~TRINITY_DN7387_c0_g2_i3.p1  ORF type:complete len:624 (+),score=121.86 TRINITY_DN7387_c0_g2_i3:280-2151(+)